MIRLKFTATGSRKKIAGRTLRLLSRRKGTVVAFIGRTNEGEFADLMEISLAHSGRGRAEPNSTLDVHRCPSDL